jgi:hypothetical protein
MMQSVLVFFVNLKWMIGLRGMIKNVLARYTSSHYTDIYTRYVDTNILLKTTDRVTGPSFRSRIPKTEHAVEAPWLTPSGEIQEGAISRIVRGLS